MDDFDVAVVGAGPAGLAAAVDAGELGLRVVMVDAGDQPGGQYWRHPDERLERGDEALGHHDWRIFTDLRSRLRRLQAGGRVTSLTRTQVWFLEAPAEQGATWVLRVNAVTDGTRVETTASALRARRLVLCPGGYDRQLPIPGWDLPGVMAAGGVQALLKAHRSVAGTRAVVAGTGPFLLPVAAGLAHAGAEVVSVCEAGDLTGWATNALGAAQLPSKALEAAEYAATFLRHRIPYRPRTAVTRIHGDDVVTAVTTSRLDRQGRMRPGTERRIDADLVALGWGFTPSLELVLAAGAETCLDADGSLAAVVDELQHSTVRDVYIAGEATGVGGAVLAVAEGRLAALSCVQDGGTAVSAASIRALQSVIRRARAFARAMHRAHPVPPRWHEWLTDDTTVCRCEEVTFGEVCAARDDLGARDARTVKLLTRTGMGWCQGRICGFATAQLAAAQEGRRPTASDLRPMAKRSFASPVTLGDLATIDDEPRTANG